MEAHAITCVAGDPLIHYRVGRATSSMGAKDAHALDFHAAFMALKASLEQASTYDAVRRSFENWAVSAMLYNLDTLRSSEAFREVFAFLGAHGLADLGLEGPRDGSYFYDPIWPVRLRAIANGDVAAYFLSQLRVHDRTIERLMQANAWLDARMRELDATLAATYEELAGQRGRGDDLERFLTEERAEREALLGSAEYRLGSALGKVPRAIQRRMLKHDE